MLVNRFGGEVKEPGHVRHGKEVISHRDSNPKD